MVGRATYKIGATWSSEINTDVQLNVSVADKHFRIDLFAANFEACPKSLKEYLRHVERSDPTYIQPLLEQADGVELVDPLEDFYDWATEPFAALFREIKPLDRDRLYTLQDCLFPERFMYTLQVAGDELVPVPRDVDPDGRSVGVLLPASETLDTSTVQVYRPTDVHVPLNDNSAALPPSPRKVQIKECGACFFKQMLAGDISMAVTELATYAKMRAAELDEDVRVSRLLGIVEDQQSSRIVGLLLSYIGCENKTLSCAAYASDHTTHNKWLKQMTHSLKKLHAHQIVWGDAKPDNVLIDEHDDAYLVDFGGGYTNGWVDKELMNTQDGDLQGLRRMAEFLAALSV